MPSWTACSVFVEPDADSSSSHCWAFTLAPWLLMALPTSMGTMGRVGCHCRNCSASFRTQIDSRSAPALATTTRILERRSALVRVESSPWPGGASSSL